MSEPQTLSLFLNRKPKLSFLAKQKTHLSLLSLTSIVPLLMPKKKDQIFASLSCLLFSSFYNPLKPTFFFIHTAFYSQEGISSRHPCLMGKSKKPAGDAWGRWTKANNWFVGRTDAGCMLGRQHRRRLRLVDCMGG